MQQDSDPQAENNSSQQEISFKTSEAEEPRQPATTVSTSKATEKRGPSHLKKKSRIHASNERMDGLAAPKNLGNFQKRPLEQEGMDKNHGHKPAHSLGQVRFIGGDEANNIIAIYNGLDITGPKINKPFFIIKIGADGEAYFDQSACNSLIQHKFKGKFVVAIEEYAASITDNNKKAEVVRMSQAIGNLEFVEPEHKKSQPHN